MADVPINAPVECRDGAAGTSTHVIVNPLSRKVTHFVVRETASARSTERLVPVELVGSTARDRITLSCSRAELAALQPFVETRYVSGETPVDDGYLFLPLAVARRDTQIPFKIEHVPAGELAFSRGTSVEATDGTAGRVEELLVDPDTGEVTHLVLRRGALLGREELAVPVSAIARVVDDMVFLKIDRSAVAALPTLEVERRYSRDVLPLSGADAISTELLVLTFGSTDTADAALRELKAGLSRRAVEILNVAVIAKDARGAVHVRETEDVNARHGTVFGAITGALIGLIGGPVGAIVGAAAGAAAGGISAKLLDFGFPDDYLRQAQERLQPGTSALLVLVDGDKADAVLQALASFEGEALRQQISEAMLERMVEDAQRERE